MLSVKPYKRKQAVAYARKWALSRNPLFADFSKQGGNCTNFVSQCIYAGSCVMNNTKDFGWYYRTVRDRAPAWTGVEYLYEFLTDAPAFRINNQGIGPYAKEIPSRLLRIGDVIQLADETGDWYHSLIVSALECGKIFVCAQSDDALDRPLSSYRYAKARYLHVAGVRFETEDTACFDRLMEGIPQKDRPDPIVGS